ncbi:hypothetical protein, partial [Lactiplantibacillus plantarum]|uniref:hypothetical protein n=1 Tax=Lactiplantibacillus plantarum TaxID=1590 RepID=UPI0022E72432
MIDKVKATNLGQSVKADHFKLVALCIMHRFERLALNMVKTDCLTGLFSVSRCASYADLRGWVPIAGT